jgi:pimeloyl-ACP methyl ester carboxylesterase
MADAPRPTRAKASKPPKPPRPPRSPKPGESAAADEARHHHVERGLVALGVGLAATGLGAVLGLATERAAVARMIRPPDPAEGGTDGRGGPALGSLRGEPRLVLSGPPDAQVPLHVEVDEPDHELDRPDLGPPLTVVLSHGYALTLDSWHYQRLSLRGRQRLVLWDQRGHGRSGTGPAGSSTIDQVGRDLAAVIDAVAPEGPLVLLGHSMGGMTVMSLAQDRPELFAERVVGVGLFSTSAGGEAGVDLGFKGLARVGLRFAPVAARTLSRRPGLVQTGRRIGSDLESLLVRRYSFASPVPAQLVAFAAGMISQTRLEVISDFLPTFSTHDKREALAAMSAHEVLVMVGDHDVLTPAAESEQIVRLLPAAEHVVVRQAGHLLPLEHPDIVNGYLDELVEHAQIVAKAMHVPSRHRGWGRRTVTPVRAHWPRRRPAARRSRKKDAG